MPSIPPPELPDIPQVPINPADVPGTTPITGRMPIADAAEDAKARADMRRSSRFGEGVVVALILYAALAGGGRKRGR